MIGNTIIPQLFIVKNQLQSNLYKFQMQIQSQSLDIFGQKSYRLPKQSLLVHSMTLSQENYLNQFFFVETPQQQQTFSSFIQQQSNQHRQTNQNTQIISSQLVQTQVRIKKSVFHNFQKHLIVTLKQCINMSDITKNSHILGQMAVNLWRCFYNSKSFNKQILVWVFGSYQNKVKKGVIINKFLMTKLNISEEEIQFGQCNLRVFIKNKLSNSTLQACYSHRKMNGLELFKQYVNQFLQELGQGGIKKRLPKSKKLQIVR